MSQITTTFTLTVADPLRWSVEPAPLTDAQVGQPYSYQFPAPIGGSGNYSWAVSGPAGLSIDGNGLLTWASPVAGSHAISVFVTD